MIFQINLKLAENEDGSVKVNFKTYTPKNSVELEASTAIWRISLKNLDEALTLQRLPPKIKSEKIQRFIERQKAILGENVTSAEVEDKKPVAPENTETTTTEPEKEKPPTLGQINIERLSVAAKYMELATIELAARHKKKMEAGALNLKMNKTSKENVKPKENANMENLSDIENVDPNAENEDASNSQDYEDLERKQILNGGFKPIYTKAITRNDTKKVATKNKYTKVIYSSGRPVKTFVKPSKNTKPPKNADKLTVSTGDSGFGIKSKTEIPEELNIAKVIQDALRDKDRLIKKAINSNYNQMKKGVEIVGTKTVQIPVSVSNMHHKETVDLPIPYHKNMARHFPGADQRTPEQQALREKNTEAARSSRAKAKATNTKGIDEYINATTKSLNYKKTLSCEMVYCNELLKHLGRPTMDWQYVWECFQSGADPEDIMTGATQDANEDDGASNVSSTDDDCYVKDEVIVLD